jgi:tetratricopeptide (TPR) repeat protein
VDPLWDVFLSHGSPDKPWVETLAAELRSLGLLPFLDAREIEPGDSFPHVLSDGLAGSRFLVLILSPHSARPWVNLEWAAFLAHHGPLGRLIPVLLEPTEIPALLAPVQRIDATHRDAARVAGEIARLVGRPGELKEGDARRLVLGQDLVFHLASEGDELRITDPMGHTRTVTPPWKVDNIFGVALHFFDRLSREPAETDEKRADLFARATTLGSLLFSLLFDEEGRERLTQAMIPGRPRPLITIRSEDDSLLALPWELLHHEGSFLLRDARVDLARSTPGDVGPEALLREASEPLKLVVNVSVPEGSHLDYEGESYRITRALSERCRFVPTELGSLDDLVETVRSEKPTAIHFSGHGAPGALAFEDEEGRKDEVSIHDLVAALRKRIDGALPPLFYLASCHGNDWEAGAESSAARLHREGVPQVVGYYGPIVDELSTRAEVAFYRALAEGETTRYAVRQARQALASPFWALDSRHRPRSVAEARVAPILAENTAAGRHTHPFAWAQLVFYHRGPDHPLSLPSAPGARPSEEALRRTFQGVGDRRVLSTGFIGRRGELHRVRRKIREGERVFVFQGLGGLGKSTLAFQVIPMLLRGEQGSDSITLWCQETEQQPNRAQALVDQLLEHCRRRFGLDWEQVVHAVDRQAGDDPVQRFALFLQVLLQNVPRLVLYLDNLESLLVGPRDEDEKAFGEWASPDLGRLWQILTELTQNGDRLYLVSSCRYRNPAFAGALLPVSSLPPDALYRLMGWFPALRRLSGAGRARLVERLAGHPRAVEYVNDLLAHALAEREDREGPWRLPEDPGEADLEREWAELVAPVLPDVREKLWANLLLAEIWERVLDERARRMLFRMTLLRRSWEWKLAAVLGEEEDQKVALATAERLRGTSMLEAIEFASGRRYTLHPATVQFVRDRFGDDEMLCRATHRRMGDYLEAEAKTSPFIEVDLDAGYHLFQAGEYDRAYDLLGTASDWLRDHGRVREGLQILSPFLTEQVQKVMALERLGNMLSGIGLAFANLGEVEKAIEFHEQTLVIAREISDRRNEGTALGDLGNAYLRLGESEKAIEFFEQALVISREIGSRRGEATALGSLGNAYRGLDEVEKSIGFCAQHLAIAREIGDRPGEGSALGNLGNAYSHLGELERAIEFYEEALVVHRELGDFQMEGNDLGNLGNAYRRLGELEKAIGFFERRLVIAREIGDIRGEGSVLGNLGIAYASIGESDKAVALLEQALEIGQAIKFPELIRVATNELARLRGGGGGEGA